MKRNVMLVAILLSAALAALSQNTKSAQSRIDEARKILREAPLIDGHNDLPWQFRERSIKRLGELDLRKDQSKIDKPLHTDLARLRQGGLGGQFWSVYITAETQGPEATQQVLEQMDIVRRLTEMYPEALEMAFTADDIVRIHKGGKIASLMGIEGGNAINNSMATMRQLYAAGARYITLTHSLTTTWADSATDAPKHGGLSPFGVEVVKEMNRLGMLVDLSHVSPETMNDTLDAVTAPVIFSHSASRALDAHPRNVPDEVLRRLPKNGGVVMICFVPSFISDEHRLYQAEKEGTDARLKYLHRGSPDRAAAELKAWEAEHPPPPATISQVADHIDHVRKVAGIDHIGIGSDFDGIELTPQGLGSVADYPNLFAELLARGYSPEDLRKIAGGNVLRALRVAEEVSARLRKERSASEATFAPAK